jgi:50S ribosomal subunit-associated GTPase HflX
LIGRYRSQTESGFVVVAANKCDSLEERDRDLETEKLEKVKTANKGFVRAGFLTSAKTGENIQELFQYIGEQLLAAPASKSTTDGPAVNISTKKKEDTRCCS